LISGYFANFGYSKAIGQYFDSVVDIPTVPYQFSWGLPPQENDIQKTDKLQACYNKGHKPKVAASELARDDIQSFVVRVARLITWLR